MKLSNKQKHNFPHNQRTLNVSPNICHGEKTKNLIIFWLRTNKNRGMILNPVQLFKKKFDYKYFNLMTQFLVPLVTSFVGSRLKLSRMSRYKCMTPFLYHIQLVIFVC